MPSISETLCSSEADTACATVPAGITIRALNPDDDSEVRQLCELYSSAIESGPYPFSQVDCKDFWRNHAGQRFITATFRQGRDIIGHVGLRTDEFQPNVVELLFPVLSESAAESFGNFSKFCQVIRSEFDAFLSSQAERKGWEWVVAYLPAAVPGMMEVAWNALGLVETAVMPLHRDRSGPGEKVMAENSMNDFSGNYSGDVVCLLRRASAGSGAESASLLTSPFDTLVAPEHHAELALWIAAKFRPQAKVTNVKMPHLTALKSASVSARAAPAFESRMSRRLAARTTTVYPQALSSNQELLAHLRAERARPHLVSIAATHASSRSVCALMEELGFRFAGFLPFYRGDSHCVFALHSTNHGKSSDGKSTEGNFIISPELREESILARYLERSNGGKKALGDACSTAEHRGSRREKALAALARAS